MTHHKTRRRLMGVTSFALLALVAFMGCYEDAEFEYGERFNGRLYQVYDGTEGIHPSQAVLEDELNPFRLAVPFDDTKWDIQGSTSGPVLQFYSWASILALQPTGEHQFYTALSLQGIYDEGLAPDEELSQVRDMAVAAFQSVLDNFPDAVTYDASGTFSYPLATPAYNAMVELGGPIEGGWVLVDTPSGQIAMKP